MALKIPIWFLIPILFVLTLFYYGLGYFGYWNYTINDLINGNLFIIFLVGIVYLCEAIYKRIKKNG